MTKCPICNKAVPQKSANRPDSQSQNAGRTSYLPFCSARCQHLDLAGWLSDGYFIPGDGNSENPPDNSDLS